MESICVFDGYSLGMKLSVLEKIGNWAELFSLRHEMSMIGETATVKVLRELVSCKTKACPGIHELRELLVRTAFLVETDPTGWPPKYSLTLKTAVRRIKKYEFSRFDADKVFMLINKANRLKRFVQRHDIVLSQLRGMKKVEWAKHVSREHYLNKQTTKVEWANLASKEKYLRKQITKRSTQLDVMITCVLEEQIRSILNNLTKTVRDFNSSSSKMLGKLVEGADPKILARQMLPPMQMDYFFPQIEKSMNDTISRLPQTFCLKPVEFDKRQHGDHERAPLLINEFEDDIAEHLPTSGYFKVLRNSMKHSNSFLKLKIGQTVKRKLHHEEGNISFGWRRICKFGPKRFGFFYQQNVSLAA